MKKKLNNLHQDETSSLLPLKRVHNTSVMSCDGINIDIYFFSFGI